jgi:hypothetical protein
MNQGTEWGLLMKKKKSQKSRASVPLSQRLRFGMGMGEEGVTGLVCRDFREICNEQASVKTTFCLSFYNQSSFGGRAFDQLSIEASCESYGLPDTPRLHRHNRDCVRRMSTFIPKIPKENPD